MDWIHESPARWDDSKARIIGGAPAGALPTYRHDVGAILSGDWWRAERDGAVVGYGWMDIVWGDGEVLLAVDPSAQRSGVGAFILQRLEQEAAARGLRYICNVVLPTHPTPQRLSRWLRAHGFTPSTDDDRLIRKIAAG